MPRPVAHLANLDLILLVALRELVRERSVTRAAQRLGVTQPAASAALSRLRRHFGDELRVRRSHLHRGKAGRPRGEVRLLPLGILHGACITFDRKAAEVSRLAGRRSR